MMAAQQINLTKKWWHNHRVHYGVAFLLGMSHVLCFAPYGWWAWQVVLWSIMFGVVMQLSTQTNSLPHWSRRNVMMWGGWFGVGWFAAGMYWIFTGSVFYAGTIWPLALGMYLFAVFGLATYPLAVMGLMGVLQHRLSRQAALSIRMREVLLVWAWAVLWLAAEWLRAEWSWGFPWVLLGTAHTDGWLRGWLPVIGGYGMAGLVPFISGWLYLAVRGVWQWFNTTNRSNVQTLFVMIGIPVLHLVGVSLLTVWVLQQTWTLPVAQPPLNVLLLQGNIPQLEKFDTQQQQRIYSTHLRLLREQTASVDVAIFPETALAVNYRDVPQGVWDVLQGYVNERQTDVILGMSKSDKIGEEIGLMSLSNSLLHLKPVQATLPLHPTAAPSKPFLARYDKQHLVILGEYLPRWMFFLRPFVFPAEGDLIAGAVQQTPFYIKGWWIAPSVCFDTSLPYGLSRFATHSQILLNASNLGFFYKTSAPYQFSQINRLRAMETGRPLIQVSNDLVTAIYSPRGEIIQALPEYTEASLLASVTGTTGETPWVRLVNQLDHIKNLFF
jgi:apolipoprotein N-acyltransferase